MPLKVVSKAKAAKAASPILHSTIGVEQVQTNSSGLLVSNRSIRTLISWIADPSPSMTGFTDAQLGAAKAMVAELRQLPTTARTVMMNIVQIGTPPLSSVRRKIHNQLLSAAFRRKRRPKILGATRATIEKQAIFAHFSPLTANRMKSSRRFSVQSILWQRFKAIADRHYLRDSQRSMRFRCPRYIQRIRLRFTRRWNVPRPIWEVCSLAFGPMASNGQIVSQLSRATASRMTQPRKS